MYYTHDQLMGLLRSLFPVLWEQVARRYRPAFLRLTDDRITRALAPLEGMYWSPARVAVVSCFLRLRRDQMLEWLQDNRHDQ